MEKEINDLKSFISRFSANASKAKQATSRQKTLDKLQLNDIKPSSRVSPFIRFKPKKRLGDKVLEVKSISKSYDEDLFKDFSCTIGPEERVAIIGKNGIGKTTLLKILRGELKSDTGSINVGETVQFSVFPQDASDVIDPEARALDWLNRFSGEEVSLSETELRFLDECF